MKKSNIFYYIWFTVFAILVPFIAFYQVWAVIGIVILQIVLIIYTLFISDGRD